MNGDGDKSKPLSRKPSFKNRKPPEVKQTLTSKYRLLKANPLLMMAIVSDQEDKEKLLLDKPLKTLATALGKSSEILNGKPPVEKNRAFTNQTLPKPHDIKSSTKVNAKPKTSFNISNLSKINFTADQFLSSTVIEQRRESVVQKSFKQGTEKSVTRTSTSNNKFTASSKLSLSKSSVNGLGKQQINHKPPSLNRKDSLNNKHPSSKVFSTVSKPKTDTRLNNTMSKVKLQNNQAKTDNKPKPLRRSLSAQHFDKKKKEMISHLRSCNTHPKKSQSLEELRTKNKENKVIEELNFSTITEESSFGTAPSTPALLFKTPLAYDRRSIKTPNTTNNRRSLFLSTPASQEMSAKLNEWLKRRGKSLGDFHHLKCFGIHGQNKTKVTKLVDEENKENIETSPQSDSYEELRITIPQSTGNKEIGVAATNNVDLQVVAKEALQDLHKLILEGYPCDQCDCWLKLIKQKYKQLEEDPQYWECRAALEQTKGNINLAVECYKTAIVQGAEVQAVDQSLDQLLRKFSLLNINSKDGNLKEAKDRARIVQDARNIFKSSIIQFAVQERTLKKKNAEGVTIEKRFIATPVRRSTRLSRSAYTSTPGVKIYSTLQELDSQSIDFRHNKALND